jgi:hypothetical protein
MAGIHPPTGSEALHLNSRMDATKYIVSLDFDRLNSCKPAIYVWIGT